MTVNATANYRLIRSLDPLLRASEAGRALFVTCRQARAGKPFWGGYAASKAALEALVMAYAAETRRMALRVNLIDPGPLRTRLRAKAPRGPPGCPSRKPSPKVSRFAETGCTHHGRLIEAADHLSGND
jgi:NAD(P)-dependent dehydrogenase (short-subunit alcohol dehydrogenase family)